jgi:hypothetical protein
VRALGRTTLGRVTTRAWWIATFGLAACGGQVQMGTEPIGVSTAAPTVSASPPEARTASPIAAAPAQITLRTPHVATVGGRAIAFDGIEEGLAWPALEAAIARKSGDPTPLVIDVARDVPMVDLERAAWTLRSGDVRVQTPDDHGSVYVVELRARGVPRPGDACHLAVFLQPDGTLHIASPGGQQDVTGDRAAESFARGLADANATCPIRYVAFGAASNGVPWGPVFDVIVAVDRAKAAGDARYVLGDPIRIK